MINEKRILKMSEKKIKMMRETRLNGKTLGYIAEVTDVSIATVHRYVKDIPWKFSRPLLLTLTDEQVVKIMELRTIKGYSYERLGAMYETSTMSMRRLIIHMENI